MKRRSEFFSYDRFRFQVSAIMVRAGLGVSETDASYCRNCGRLCFNQEQMQNWQINHEILLFTFFRQAISFPGRPSMGALEMSMAWIRQSKPTFPLSYWFPNAVQDQPL